MRAQALAVVLRVGSGVAIGAAAAIVLFFTPTQGISGLVPKVFYLHVPAAFLMLASSLLVFWTGVAFLWRRSARWDVLFTVGSRLSVLSSSIVLGTGMLWGKMAWGHWWTWSPRLTFSLIYWLLYLLLLVSRAMMSPGTQRTTLSSVYAILAFLDVPLVYLSVKLLPDIHPTDITLEPTMKLALSTSTIAAFLVTLAWVQHACTRAWQATISPVPTANA